MLSSVQAVFDIFFILKKSHMTMIVECHVNKKSHMSVNFRRETTKLWENIRGRNS